MSMDSYKGKLYIINFKDETLSVIDMKSLKLVDMNGRSVNLPMVYKLLKKTNTIWIGGHGSGSQPNETVKVMNLENGQIVKEIKFHICQLDFQI